MRCFNCGNKLEKKDIEHLGSKFYRVECPYCLSSAILKSKDLISIDRLYELVDKKGELSLYKYNIKVIDFNMTRMTKVLAVKIPQSLVSRFENSLLMIGSESTIPTIVRILLRHFSKDKNIDELKEIIKMEGIKND